MGGVEGGLKEDRTSGGETSVDVTLWLLCVRGSSVVIASPAVSLITNGQLDVGHGKG